MEQTILGITRWVALAMWRDGGQRGARRNAWRAMVDDTQRSRERAEVESALRVIAEQPATSPVATRG
ncbi:MAG TPA: hypothetical protein VFJ17_13310 [Mycobacteriales bacterium]|jgi:hypothetical protein|nr:hypothetical protein [Mycobacteriales bacterium]